MVSRIRPAAEVPPYGLVHYPRGSVSPLDALFDEVSEYFDHGVRVGRGDVVFDVGANIGAFALYVAQRLQGDVRFFCFEPAPPIYDALKANFRNPLLRGGNHRLLPLALTAAPRTAETTDVFFFRTLPTDSTIDLEQKRLEFEDFFDARGRDGERALRRALPGAMGKGLGAAFHRLMASIPKGPFGRWTTDQALGLERHRARLATLSEVVREHRVERIDLLKVDVEGSELGVLEGIDDATWPRIGQVVLEGHNVNGRQGAIESLLADRGFERIVVSRPALADERGLPTNFLLTARRSLGAMG